jgi:two-component system, cell cycle response regulator DivK
MPLCYIVEDHGDTREGYAEYLQNRGFDVRMASGAAELRDLLSSAVPAAVVMDLALPGVDGLALTRELRANPLTRVVPVLVVSASVRPEDRAGALVAGCSAFLAKPVDPETIVRELNRLLGVEQP